MNDATDNAPETDPTALPRALSEAERAAIRPPNASPGQPGPRALAWIDAATALLAEQAAQAAQIEEEGPWLPLLYRIRVHLAGQPAAHRGDVLGDGTWIRTPEEERAHAQPEAPSRVCKYHGSKPECPYCYKPAAPSLTDSPFADHQDIEYREGQDRTEAEPPPKAVAPVTTAGSALFTGSTSSATSERTEAEQAVLDAMGPERVAEEELRFYADREQSEPLGKACAAELARRGLK